MGDRKAWARFANAMVSLAAVGILASVTVQGVLESAESTVLSNEPLVRSFIYTGWAIVVGSLRALVSLWPAGRSRLGASLIAAASGVLIGGVAYWFVTEALMIAVPNLYVIVGGLLGLMAAPLQDFIHGAEPPKAELTEAQPR